MGSASSTAKDDLILMDIGSTIDFHARLHRLLKGLKPKWKVPVTDDGTFVGEREIKWNPTASKFVQVVRIVQTYLHLGESPYIQMRVVTKLHPVRLWRRRAFRGLGYVDTLDHLARITNVDAAKLIELYSFTGSRHIEAGWQSNDTEPNFRNLYWHHHHGCEFQGPALEGAARFISYTPERYLTRILGITDQSVITEVSRLVATELASYKKDGWNLELLEGDQITKAYRDEVGGESCMTGPSKSRFTEIYAANPSKVKLAVLSHKDRKSPDASLRCLVWITESGRMVYDRIYPSSNHGVAASMMKLNLKERFPGIVSCYDKDDGKVGEVVRLNLGNNEYVPYMDTFRLGYRRINKGELIVGNTGCDIDKYLQDKGISRSDYKSQAYEFSSTEGGPFNSEPMVFCEDCECEVPEEDTVSVHHGLVCCSCSERYHQPANRLRDRLIHEDNLQWSDRLDLWFDPEYGDGHGYRYLEQHSDWYEKDETVEDRDGTYQIKDDCVEVLDEDGSEAGWMLKDEAYYHDDSGKYYVDEDAADSHNESVEADA